MQRSPMHCVRVCAAVLLCFVTVDSSFAQQIASPTAQGSQALRQSLAALCGGQSLADVTLSGTARRISGSDDESGTATLKAMSGDASRVDLSLPSGVRSEILNSTTAPPSGSWSGPDGVSHPIAYHNLLTDSVWFFPVFTVGRLLDSGNYVVSYIGQETYNGQTVQHLAAYQSAAIRTPSGTPTFSHLTQMDLFLDSMTLLPTALDFNVHPDNDMGLDIPVEVRLSDYRSLNGAQISFRVQQFLNNNLLLDLQFTNAQPNSGLSASLFNVQ